MEIAARLTVGWAILIVGFSLYALAKYNMDQVKNISWSELLMYFFIGLIGIYVIALGERILDWPMVPEKIRYIIIGLLFTTGIACYVRLQQQLKSNPDFSGAEILYFSALLLGFAGIGLTAIELGY